DPAVGVLLLACLALLFASAALHKLRDLPAFTEVLRAYRVLPAAAVRLAPLVPLAELLVAAGLTVSATRSGAGLGGAALLTAYAAAIAVNLRRGRRDLACGCGGPDDARPIAPWMVARNLMLALLLAITLVPWKTRPLSPVDALTVGGGVVIATLLYVSLDQLLGRAAAWTAALRGPR
ncbi:MAG TPA: MauE/DoxX family redox-associated membrane protein, partial [Steroidobacteraceae bacterium]|nr:MauE/DoxX family redox-associated membrane protein [Steroidobacteraceae bacterium]